MATTLTPNQALQNLISGLKESKKDELWAEIELLKEINLLFTNPVDGTFWDNHEKKERAKQAMKASWASRKPSFELSWRSNGRQLVTQDLEEISKLVGKTINTFRTSMSTGKGKASFSHGDDIITVVKLVKATTSLQQ